jgi:hypothetical protein
VHHERPRGAILIGDVSPHRLAERAVVAKTSGTARDVLAGTKEQ